MSETKITKMVVQKEGRKLIFNPAGDVDLSQYYTKSEIDSKFNNYALKTEIPDTSTLATKTELNSVKSTATTANNTANSAKTTAQNALNTANSKMLNIATNMVYVRLPPTAGSTIDSAYANKNLYVSHPCLLKLDVGCYMSDDDNKSVTMNGVEIFTHGYHNRSGTHSYGGVNYTIPVYCRPSDIIKVSGRYMDRQGFFISMYAAGTNAFLHT